MKKSHRWAWLAISLFVLFGNLGCQPEITLKEDLLSKSQERGDAPLYEDNFDYPDGTLLDDVENWE